MSAEPTEPVVAAILAAGSGSRIPGDVPKQFRELAGQPLLAHSLRAFETCPRVDQIIVVGAADRLREIEDIAQAAQITKLVAVVPGGTSRTDSSIAALAKAPSDGTILIHDAARPLVEQTTIEAVLDALRTGKAAAPAMPASDTIVIAVDDSIATMPDRATLRRMQTPQGFELSTIRRAYETAQADPGFVATDDCGVVHEYAPEVSIALVPGSERNIKVTHDQDLTLAELLLSDGS